MKSQKFEIPGLLLLDLEPIADSRGFFLERFNTDKLLAAGIEFQAAQVNHSLSLPGVLRGLHYQVNPEQGKIIQVLSGRIWDVAVDLRPGSSTRGRYIAFEIAGDGKKALFIPAGFAHGFCVLGDEPADMLYVVDKPYNPQGQRGIRYCDPTLSIPWPIKDPILSNADREYPEMS